MSSSNEEDLQPTKPTEKRSKSKSRSVSFNPNVELFEIPSRTELVELEKLSRRDFLDVLFESYRLETSSSFPSFSLDEKKYVPRTSRSRSNPQWRQDRIKSFTDKIEDFQLWNRDEERKTSREEFSRREKLEQIRDRLRNQDVSLQLMRHRHQTRPNTFSRLSTETNSNFLPTNFNPIFNETFSRLSKNKSPLRSGRTLWKHFLALFSRIFFLFEFDTRKKRFSQRFCIFFYGKKHFHRTTSLQ